MVSYVLGQRKRFIVKVKFTMPQNSGLRADFNTDEYHTIATKAELNAEIEARIEGDNDLQSEIARVENEIPDISGLATKAELQEVENEIPDISGLATKTELQAVEDEIPDISNLATKTELQEVENEIPVVNNGTLTIKQDGETIGVFRANDSNNVIVNLEAGGGAVDSVNGKIGEVVLTASDVGALPNTTDIPTKTSDLTNDSGYITNSALTGYATETFVTSQGYITGITSSDVTTALGYTPYNSTNPNGYTSNVGTVTSVNNIQPDGNGNVTVPASIPTNMVTTNTDQNISGIKTFIGAKRINFKQSTVDDKLGFTLYNPSSAELAAFEYRPNTVNGNALLNINTNSTNACYIGFRYWISHSPGVNIIAPKVPVAGDYYIPINITNGTKTVTSNSSGTVNISSLLPTIADVQAYISTEVSTNSLKIGNTTLNETQLQALLNLI